MSGKSTNKAIIGRSYAKAFFSAQVTEQDVSTFLEFSKALANDPLFAELLATLKNSKNCKKDNASWIEGIAKQFKLSQKSINFLKLIIVKGRFEFLINICDEIENISNQKAGYDFVTLRIHEDLPDAQIEKIKQDIKKIMKIDPILKIIIEPSLLGGYIIQTKTIIVDNSLKKRLEKLHNVMKGVA